MIPIIGLMVAGVGLVVCGYVIFQVSLLLGSSKPDMGTSVWGQLVILGTLAMMAGLALGAFLLLGGALPNGYAP